jgi:hypothetical protein
MTSVIDLLTRAKFFPFVVGPRCYRILVIIMRIYVQVQLHRTRVDVPMPRITSLCSP